MRVRFGRTSGLALVIVGLGASLGVGQQPFPNVLDAVPPVAGPVVPGPHPLTPLPGHPAPAPADTLVPDPGYLQVNPNGRTSLCTDDDDEARRLWLTGAFLFGFTTDLGPVDRKSTIGARVGGGMWFDDYRTLGVDLSFLALHDTFSEFLQTPVGIALVNSPVTLTTADANLRAHLLTHARYRIDGLAGYRVLSLSEQYNAFGPGAPLSAKSTTIVHAFQVGFVGDYHFGPYFGELTAKLGVGQNTQRATLNGITAETTKTVVIPEINFRVGYTLGSGSRMFLGYNLLYLSNAVRPNNFGPSDFMLNAAQAGLEFSF